MYRRWDRIYVHLALRELAKSQNSMAWYTYILRLVEFQSASLSTTKVHVVSRWNTGYRRATLLRSAFELSKCQVQFSIQIAGISLR